MKLGAGFKWLRAAATAESWDGGARSCNKFQYAFRKVEVKVKNGGGWRGVSKIRSDDDLWAAYNESGEMLMHLQKSVEPYDVFARAGETGALKVALFSTEGVEQDSR